MYGLIVAIHVLACALLITIILMQSGRGGGLTGSFAPAESLFGAKTSAVLVKGTTILASLFLVTCLSLAFLSTKKNKSLIDEKTVNSQIPVEETASVPAQTPVSSAPEAQAE